MHKALVLAAGLALVASAAFAQSSDDSTSSSPRSGYGSDSSDWHGGHGWNRDDNDRGWHHRMSSDDSGRGDQGGASFRLRNGDRSIAVRCGDGESMRACVDATVVLMEKLKGLEPGAPAPSGASTAPNASSSSSPSPSATAPKP